MRRGILATTAELAALREKLPHKPFESIYALLHKRCSMILQSAPAAEQQWQAAWAAGSWGAALEAARAAQGRIIDLCIAHHIDHNTAFRDRAAEELRSIVSWSTWVDPCHAGTPADLCTAELAVAAVVGLDWLWDDVTEADRLRTLRALRQRVIDPYIKAVKDGVWWHQVYHNWNAVMNCGCGLAGLMLGDEEASAREAYRLARAGLVRFTDALGREGGWDEGTGYWGFGMRFLLLMAEAAARTLDDHSLYHARGMDATGLFPIYFTPNGQAASFGDVASVPAFGMFYLLVKHYGQKELTWWLDHYAFNRDVTTTGRSTAGLAMLFRPVDAETSESPDLAPVKVFNEIGWAAMADHWPRPGFYVAAKTGSLSANHSQLDMNSIQLQADGEMLLVDAGNPPYSRKYFSQERNTFYEAASRAHNTITIADRDHQIDAQGSIIEAMSDHAFRWVACDAGTALGENVHFIRHVVMLLGPAGKGFMVVVLDELASPVPQRFCLHWHTQGLVEMSQQSPCGGTIRGQRGGLQFAVASTVRMTAQTESSTLASGRPDNAIRCHAASSAKAMFASIFSRVAMKDKPTIKTANGQVRVKIGKVELRFRSLKRHLQLSEVVGL
jgi:hypothetical protein